MNNVYLDCSALHDIVVKTEGNIPLDGSYFISDLKEILNDFKISHQEVNRKDFKKELMLTLINSRPYHFSLDDLEWDATKLARRINIIADSMIKEWNI